MLRRRVRGRAAGDAAAPIRSSAATRTRGAVRRNRPARSRGGRRASRPTSAGSPRPPHRVCAIGPVGGLRHAVDDRPDRRRTRPPAAPPPALGRRGRGVGEPRRGSRAGPRSWPRSSSPSSASTACATRSGRCAPTGDGLGPGRAAHAARPSGAAPRGRPARPRPTPAATARRADRDLSPARPTSGRRGSGASSDQRDRTWSSAGSNEQAIVRRSPASALR